MTKPTKAEDFFLMYKENNLRLFFLGQQIEMLEEQLTGLKSFDYSSIKVHVTDSNYLVNIICNKQILEQEKILIEKKNILIEKILSMMGETGELLKNIYIDEMPTDKIQAKFNISQRTYYRYKKIALQKFIVILGGVFDVGGKKF